jgi:predicted double-glycine peptidase
MGIERMHWKFAALVALAICSHSAAAEEKEEQTVAVTRDPQRIFEKEIYSWKSLHEQNVVMQQYDYSCGAASVATICRYFWGDNITERDFLEAVLQTLTPEELKDRLKNGLSLTDLRKAAVKKGYLASIGKRDLMDLREAKVPVVVRIAKEDFEHFVVLRGFVEDRVFLADPVRGNIRMSIQDFMIQWNNGSSKDGVIFVVAKPRAKLPEYSPLLVRPYCPTRLRHELQAPLRSLFLIRPEAHLLVK